MISSCYTMDLYCRHSAYTKTGMSYADEMKLHSHAEFPHEFTGETFGQCKKQAQKRGWVFNKDGEITCPKCKVKKVKQ